MSAVNFADPFLSEPSIRLLLSRLRTPHASFAPEQLRIDFHALHPGGRSRLVATLKLMEMMGLIKRKEPGMFFFSAEPQVFSESDPIIAFAELLTRWLKDQDYLSRFVEALQLDEHGGIVLDTLRVPWGLNNLRHLLREVGVLLRDDVNVRHWKVAPRYSTVFIQAAKDRSLARNASRFTPEERRRLQDRLERLGEEAENWALTYEKKRLAEHPLVELVRRVSLDDVSAGYDIASFASSKSLSHDRFLEIKSFSDRPRFFWSIGETEKAKELGDQYILMLIDRAKMPDPSYAPLEIADPYNYFVGTVLEGWNILPTEWLAEKIEET